MKGTTRPFARSRTPAGLLLHGDCMQLLRTLAPNSVDLVCTDPPYGIGFRGNAWDTFRPDRVRRMRAQNCKRKPRADGRRAQHLHVADDAGTYDHSPSGNRAFQDFIAATGRELLRVMKPGAFLFMSMTPRQDSLSRTIAGLADAGFAIGFTSLYWTFASGFPKAANMGKMVDKKFGATRKIIGTRKMHDIRGGGYGSRRPCAEQALYGGPVGVKAKALDGSYGGYQPKPAVEVVVVAMKPLSEKTYLAQALANGKGITWLDTARIPTDQPVSVHDAPPGTFAGGMPNKGSIGNDHAPSNGRFPANLLVSDAVLDAHSQYFSLDAWVSRLSEDVQRSFPFLVVPKASKREKNTAEGNIHPTVKPLQLMSYLISLGSRPGDMVLDPFLGSGTTAVAAKALGRRYIGIERERTYLAIARARIRQSGLRQPESKIIDRRSDV